MSLKSELRRIVIPLLAYEEVSAVADVEIENGTGEVAVVLSYIHFERMKRHLLTDVDLRI